MLHVRRWLVRALVLSAGAVALAPTDEHGLARAGQTPPCDTVDVEYALTANLELADTTMGQGDGVYRIGPGTAVIRYAQRDGVPGGPATLVAYGMVEHVAIEARTLFWTTHVTTDSRTTTTRDACGVVATADLRGRVLGWSSDVRARTDGTIACDGSLCGKFGAPSPGTSPLHVPAHAVRFKPWIFAPDMKTFTMARTWSSQSDSPKQTAFVALAGREVRRTCSVAPPCP